jgi:pimeloyl-ACP methyl ester carboxylesterase
MPRPKRGVILIHGVESSGEWYADTASALEPYFECTLVSYDSYRRGGVFKVLLEPISLVAVSSVLLLLSLLLGPPHQFSARALWIASVPLAVFCSGVVAALHRRSTVANVFDQCQPVLSTVAPPHVIAHSFGTFLFGCLLERFRSVRVGEVLLVGCVLKSNFPWRRLTRYRIGSVSTVRNEVAGQDWLVRLAGVIGCVVPNLGSAGVSGFHGPLDIVHTQEDCLGPCETCESVGFLAPVHNVSLSECGHCDLLRGDSHARVFWLPVLWGIQPFEFRLFVTLCAEAAFYEEAGDLARLRIVEGYLRRRPWRWASGQSLETVIWLQMVDRYGYLGEDTEELLEGMVANAVRSLWRGVSLTLGPTQDEKTAAFLHPWSAIALAVHSACRYGA